MASASSRSSRGSDSNRYLSKYSLLVAPERSTNVPVRCDTSCTRRARSPAGSRGSPGRGGVGTRDGSMEGVLGAAVDGDGGAAGRG